MSVRLSAAICGATILFVCSSIATAGSEIRADAVNRTAYSSTVVGERYDPSAWAAAIQTDLREMFGGVRHGARASYALVEGTDKKAIVKINDVGPLMPGRVIDFDEQTMRYFDPSLRLGVIQNVRVTPLSGDDWTPGPIAQR